ncbi:BlaI/MecI/CopY family transcriptional regulator [Robiginitomaculum antarcticum]|uniref:BlaI/MecI/CopY family transcriptional regulator n=1 Tax=Robiginitomaculum antarcticum TaxID=437507 RepID=UPI00035D01EE|nr:BlaI/MecI/CopY family transcriptional regulator [Robiginitomaculum antarcticum]
MKKNRKPSAAESAILNVLWAKQPCSVKEIHDILSATKDVGYTTTLKQVQRLHSKGMVARKPGEGKSFLYSAAVKEDVTKSDLFDQFVETAFSNSVSELVMHALGNEKTSEAEINKIRAFIAKLDEPQT